MSAIVCFDIRNFSTHVSHHSSKDKDGIFKVIEDIFNSLGKAIETSRTIVGIKRETFVNYTGDGFVAIFYDKGRSLQSLLVSSLVASDVDNIIKEYNNIIINEMYLKYISPLDYGIGIHRGGVKKIKYRPEYPRESSMIGFLGHAINLSSRVQESTKNHMFKIICTYDVYRDSISVIDEKYRVTFEKYFHPLGKHKLRGMKDPKTLYGVQSDFAKKFASYMLSSVDDQEFKTGNK